MTTMNASSLPPSDREELAPLGDAELRARLRAYIDANDISQAGFAKLIGVSGPAISKYLGGKYDGDIDSLESEIEDVLHSAPLRETEGRVLFEYSGTAEIISYIESARRTNDCAVLVGEAGVGKTCAFELYRAQNPTSLLISAFKGACSMMACLRMVWRQIDTKKWRRFGLPRVEYLHRKFKDSNRVIMVDNCHRLTVGAIEFWIDFHSATQTPIIFAGNSLFLKNIRKAKDSDQLTSRVGAAPQIQLRAPDKFAELILKQLAPLHAAELKRMAVQVVKHPGHGRALEKQIRLACQIQKGAGDANPPMDIATAFRAAQTQLFNHNYSLD